MAARPILLPSALFFDLPIGCWKMPPGDAEQEELDKPGHHGLAALALDDVHDLVVGRRVELHEDLAHHAHAGFRALARQGQRVEVLHDAAHRAAELRLAHAALELVLAGVHPVLEQAVRAARLHLVGRVRYKHIMSKSPYCSA